MKRKKKEWKIPDAILAPIASRFQKEQKKTCDNFIQYAFEQIRQECGPLYAGVPLDDIRHQCVNLRKKGVLGSSQGKEASKPSDSVSDVPESILAYYETPHWIEFSRTVRKHWDNHCALCNVKAQLDVHHRTYERLYSELMTDCVPLCRKCHRVADVRRKREALNEKAEKGQFEKVKERGNWPFF